MDAQRLANYLAGDLTPEEHRAIEAQLARDPALRARLQRLRDADAALGGLPPAAPAEGFEQRLSDALAPTLREQLGGGDLSASGAIAGGPSHTPAEVPEDVAAEDELARRRDRSATSRPSSWPLAVGGVAAGLALLGVAGVAMLGLPGARDDVEMTADAPTAESAEQGQGLGPGPVVLAGDRELDEGEVASLLDEPALASLADRRFDADEGTVVAEQYTGMLGDDELLGSLHDSAAGPGVADRGDEAMDADGAGPGDDAAPTATNDLDAAARADIRRCLDTLLEGARAPIPAYVEVTSYEGEAAIAFGLLGRGADGQRYDRLEVWVLERDDCQVRTFQQRDR